MSSRRIVKAADIFEDCHFSRTACRWERRHTNCALIVSENVSTPALKSRLPAPFGKSCHANPPVFSFAPCRQGRVRITKGDRAYLHLGVMRRFGVPFPSRRPAKSLRQDNDTARDGTVNGVCRSILLPPARSMFGPGRKMKGHGEARPLHDERADCRTVQAHSISPLPQCAEIARHRLRWGVR